jgi:tetratricopeptide (TPR) repeat protein/phosphoglycerol transferase MdoB-like AlkP superfamily enzyme
MYLEGICGGDMSNKLDTAESRPRSQITLLFAVVLSPAVLRISLLVEKGVGPGVYDLRGFFSDLTVSLAVAAMLLSLSVLKFWPRILLVAAWSLLNFGSYEHVRVLSALPGFANAGYLADRTFLLGSALKASSPSLLAVVLLGSTLLAALALRKPSSTLKAVVLAVFLLPLVAAHLVWPRGLEVLSWRQTHFVAENLRWAASASFPTVGTEQPGLSQEELKRFLAADLNGTPAVKTGRPGENVLLIVLEGVSGAHLETIAAAVGLETPVRMPGLSRLAGENVVYRNFLLQAKQTNRGEYALLCGDYPRLLSGEPKMSEVGLGQLEITCLPEVMKTAGYETVYLQAAPLAFMMKDMFMPKAGFNRVIGDGWFTHSYSRNMWGVDDRAFFRQGLEMVSELRGGGKPWFLTMLTSGTHHPFNVPGGFKSPFADGSLERALSYLDGAVSEFVEALGREGVLEDTLVLITSDESASTVDVKDDLTAELSMNWGFLIAMLPEKTRMWVDEYFMQVDLALSVLDYLGIPAEEKGFTGRSVFRRYDTKRPLLFSNTLLRKVGAIDAGGDLLLCDDGFRDCLKYRLKGSIFFSDRQLVDLSGRETGFIRSVANLRPPAEEPRSVQLIRDRTVAVNALSDQFVFGGQGLTVPEGAQISLDLEVEVLGAKGQVVLTDKLIAKGKGYEETLVVESSPPLDPGDTFEIGYSFQTDRAVEDMECQLWSNSIWGEDLELKFRKAVLSTRPAEKAGRGKTGIEDREVLLNGTALSGGRMLDVTIEKYLAARSNNPDKTHILNNLGAAYGTKGLMDEAIECFEASLRMEPYNPTVHYNLGAAYGRQGLTEKAIKSFEASLRINPDWAFVNYSLGLAYGRQGLFEKAIEHLEDALRLEPEDTNIMEKLAASYRIKGLTKKADELDRKATMLKSR